tara:strand:+ start:371 stop:796 length:426 start_codon:yes stop_codon:yes gene_type:complete
MRERYHKKVRIEAKKLYLSGTPIYKIAKMDDMPSKRTLNRWKKEDAWDKSAEEVAKEVEQQVVKDVAYYKNRQFAIMTALIEDKVKEISIMRERQQLNKLSIPELLSVMKQQLLLMGEPTEKTEQTLSAERLANYFKNEKY